MEKDLQLRVNEKLDVENILKDLDKYTPKEEVGHGDSQLKIFKWDLLFIKMLLLL